MKKYNFRLPSFVICLSFFVFLGIALSSCSKDDDSFPKPSFSAITISPEKDVYQVGDKITLTVTQLTETPSKIKAETAWFFYPDGASQSDRILFVTRDEATNQYTSAQITLKLAGTVQLAFYTQYDYPNYKYDGVTLYRTITVSE